MIVLICALILIKTVRSHPLHDQLLQRIDLYIEKNVGSPECNNIWAEVMKLEFTNGSGFCQDSFLEAVKVLIIFNQFSLDFSKADQMLTRGDGVDFNLAAFSWLFKRHWNNPALSEDFKSYVLDAVLTLPFWYF